MKEYFIVRPNKDKTVTRVEPNIVTGTGRIEKMVDWSLALEFVGEVEADDTNDAFNHLLNYE